MSQRWAVVAVVVVCLIGTLSAESHTTKGTSTGKIRTYYVAAEEVMWDYAPHAMKVTTAEKFHFEDLPGASDTMDPNRTIYKKAIYREYTDATFSTLKPRDKDWEHLGMVGPLLRAEVGDTIQVVFENKATYAYSMHPHGVFYKKDSEGAMYDDGTSAADKADDGVKPGETHTYTWEVPERAGPGPHDGSSVLWVYHSHVNEIADTNSGLTGAIIVTAKGMARPDGSPKDVDREFVALFSFTREQDSHYFEDNMKLFYKDPAKIDRTTSAFYEFHHWFPINGFVFGNGPMMTMKRGERVRWYLYATSDDSDLHTPHWHGQTLIVNQMRTDMLHLEPMMTMIADMVPDNPGIWLFHCHAHGHMDGGMMTRFQVLP